MSEVRFRSDMGVRLVEDGCCGNDRLMSCAAWAEHPDNLAPTRDDTPNGWVKVNKACVKLKHNSPIEAGGLMTVYAELPGVVWWQLTRQRFMSMNSEDFSFDLESGRYKHLEPEFYLPSEDRPMWEPRDFKPMRPTLLTSQQSWEEDSRGFSAPQFLHGEVLGHMSTACIQEWRRYQRLIDMGVARELARGVLNNWFLYCDGFIGGKPLTWLQFFSKRNSTPDTATATYPQSEIQDFCRQCEALFAARWPLTYSAFVAGGRVSP